VLDWSPKYAGVQSDPLRPVNKFVTNRHGNGTAHKELDEEWLPKKGRAKASPPLHPMRAPVMAPAHQTNHQRLQPKFAVSKVATAVRSPIASVKTPTPNVAAVAKAPTASKIINGLAKSGKKPTAVLAREKRLSIEKPVKKSVSKKPEENGNSTAGESPASGYRALCFCLTYEKFISIDGLVCDVPYRTSHDE